MKTKKLFCAHCNGMVSVTYKKEMETIKVKNEPIISESIIAYCDHCNHQVWSDNDNQNLINAYDIYRVKHNLLLPYEIKAIREKYAISQDMFNNILGLEDNSIKRFERGSLQNEPQNNLIMLASNPENFKVLLKRKEDNIDPDELKRIYSAISSLN